MSLLQFLKLGNAMGKVRETSAYRLDSKNWTPTPALLQGKLQEAIGDLANQVNAFILLDQVDVPETGTVTSRVLETMRAVVKTRRTASSWPTAGAVCAVTRRFASR